MMVMATLLTFVFSLGVVGALLFLRREDLPPGFFRTQAVIGVVLSGISLVFLRNEASFEPISFLFFIFGAGFFLYLLGLKWFSRSVDRAVLLAVFLWGGFSLFAFLQNLQTRETNLFEWAMVMMSGLIMGLALVSMNVGHSYLSADKQSMRPLKTTTIALGVFVALKGLWILMGLPIAGAFFPDVKSDLAIFFKVYEVTWISVGLSRVLFGILGALPLIYLAKKTIDLESTQSATGILYAVLALVLVGETCALYIMLHTNLVV